jgi:hypothetical protein
VPAVVESVIDTRLDRPSEPPLDPRPVQTRSIHMALIPRQLHGAPKLVCAIQMVPKPASSGARGVARSLDRRVINGSTRPSEFWTEPGLPYRIGERSTICMTAAARYPVLICQPSRHRVTLT